MWLYPVALAALIGLFISAKIGLRWTWGICLQQLIILLVASAGFAFLYAPVSPPPAVTKDAAAGFCAIAAWILFFGFNIGQRIVLNHYSLDLSLFRVQQALSRRWLVKLLSWGPPGGYWCDMAVALDLYHKHQVSDADAVLDKWNKDPRMPAPAKESLIGFYLLGRVAIGDWSGIVEKFERNQDSLAASRSFVPYQMACRAYAELGRFSEALECLEKSNMQPTKTSPTNLDINFMTLFALFGSIEHLQDVYKKCRDYRSLPQYVRDYWEGRCLIIRGEFQFALEKLRKCKNETPVAMSTWHARIDYFLAVAEEPLAIFGPSGPVVAPTEVGDSAFALYQRLRDLSEVLRPVNAAPAVVSLMVLLVASYVITNADQYLGFLLPASELSAFHIKCYNLGQLTAPDLLRGQWWRLITYQLLHGNTAHLVLNVFALYLFGKSVESMYGTFRFLVIFMGAGILSGLLQIVLVPADAAIGASGAILGVFGAAIAGIIKLKDVLPPQIRKAELRWMVSIAVAQVIFDQIVNGVAAMTDPSENGVRIASFAHMAGIVAGLGIGMLLRPRAIKTARR
jgi:membrane associated rhomboid family serine protease